MLERLISVVGIAVMMGLAFAMCPKDRRTKVAWRTVGLGLVILLAFAVLVMKTPARRFFSWATGAVDALLEFSKQGAGFVFGDLALKPESLGFIFAFQILPTIVFFAALMSILYYVGIMPLIIKVLSKALSRFLGTSGAETFSTVADIFVGQTEAPLVIRPYLSKLTQSELMACMVAGFATTAGGVLAAYVGMLKSFVPDIAGHLIACSVMCAPASLVIAKLMLPESEQPETLGQRDIVVPRSATNILDAITQGTTDGLRLAVNVGAMLIAFVALTAVLNAMLGWVGDTIFSTHLSLEQIMGWVFSPLAFCMGVPMEDVLKVGSLLGQKTVLNEFIAYSSMSRELGENASWISERSRLIASYALCGFANLSSIGIQIGGYSGLAPDRRGDLSRLAFRAMLGGLLSTCLVACVAGVLL